MNRSRIYSLLIVIAMTATYATHAEKANAEINICCPCKKCPSCDCSLEAKMVDVEKSCFEVETKTICIPRVVFPWQRKKACGSCDSCDGSGCNSCVNNGAKTRCIRVIKKKKYTCPECRYSWTPNTSGCCDAGCDAACDDGCAKTDISKTLPTKVVSHGVFSATMADNECNTNRTSRVTHNGTATGSDSGSHSLVILQPSMKGRPRNWCRGNAGQFE